MSPEQGLREAVSDCLEERQGSWDRLVERSSRLVYWTLWRAMEGRQAAAREDLCRDAFQECYLRLTDRAQLEKLKNAKSPVSYLCVMATHALFALLRDDERKDRAASGLAYLSERKAEVDPARAVVKSEDAGRLSEALKTLKRKESACIELCYGQGRTHREIGLILRLPQDTVSALIRRAKDKLKVELEKKGYQP